jgi:hypothetical protein
LDGYDAASVSFEFLVRLEFQGYLPNTYRSKFCGEFGLGMLMDAELGRDGSFDWLGTEIAEAERDR